MRLDRVSSRPPGSGRLDLFGFMRGTPTSGSAGAGVDFEHRLKRDLSLFATGRVGHEWGPLSSGLVFDALTGMRWRW